MHEVPPRGASPQQLISAAAERFGIDTVREWCLELLAGRADDTDPRHPAIGWLGGTVGWPDYWARVWGARGLLHAGVPDDAGVLEDPAAPGDVEPRASALSSALADESWRVREMALKVITKHGVADPHGRVDALTDDPVERVQVQAWRALGRTPPPA